MASAYPENVAYKIYVPGCGGARYFSKYAIDKWPVETKGKTAGGSLGGRVENFNESVLKTINIGGGKTADSMFYLKLTWYSLSDTKGKKYEIPVP